jgi:hypothetical protein
VYGIASQYNHAKKGGAMSRIEGFDPASPGQQPGDANDSPVPVRVWGDPDTDIFGTGSSGLTVDQALDRENAYLPQAFAGSPEMLRVCSGTVTTGDDGAARVALPEYFEALNSEFRYQLTVVGHFAQAVVAEEIHGNSFSIRTDSPRIKVCWQVTGVRLETGIHHGTGRGPVPDCIAGLVPEVRPATAAETAGKRLQPLVQDGPVDDEELRQLLAGIRGRAEASAAAARARLKEQWGKVQESLHEDLPDHGPMRPTEG